MAQTTQCPSCGTTHAESTLTQALYVCPVCNTYLHMPARARIALLADPRSFKELDRGLVSVDPLHFTDRRPYLDRLAEAMATVLAELGAEAAGRGGRGGEGVAR